MSERETCWIAWDERQECNVLVRLLPRELVERRWFATDLETTNSILIAKKPTRILELFGRLPPMVQGEQNVAGNSGVEFDVDFLTDCNVELLERESAFVLHGFKQYRAWYTAERLKYSVSSRREIVERIGDENTILVCEPVSDLNLAHSLLCHVAAFRAVCEIGRLPRYISKKADYYECALGEEIGQNREGSLFYQLFDEVCNGGWKASERNKYQVPISVVETPSGCKMLISAGTEKACVMALEALVFGAERQDMVPLGMQLPLDFGNGQSIDDAWGLIQKGELVCRSMLSALFYIAAYSKGKRAGLCEYCDNPFIAFNKGTWKRYCCDACRVRGGERRQKV